MQVEKIMVVLVDSTDGSLYHLANVRISNDWVMSQSGK